MPAAAFSLGLGGFGLNAAADAPADILNVSYDVSRELFTQLNPVFAKEWQAKSKKAIEIKQSHAGSSSQARSILEGLQADVVTFNQVTDVQVLFDKGKLIAPDWQKKFANNASPFYSLPAFLVRKGNPKNIKDWDDLVKDGVQGGISESRKHPAMAAIPIWPLLHTPRPSLAAIKPKRWSL